MIESQDSIKFIILNTYAKTSSQNSKHMLNHQTYQCESQSHELPHRCHLTLALNSWSQKAHDTPLHHNNTHTYTIDCFRYVLRHPVIFLEACLLFRKNFNGRTTLLVMTPVKRDLPSRWARCTNRRSWHRSDGVGHLRAWGRDLGKWVCDVTRCQRVTSLVIYCTGVLWGGKLWGDAVSYCWVVRVY